MVRKYDASRRRKAAEQTRKDILQAALKLHWEGVSELEPLARAAGCSVATVRSHFQNKEDLYQNCTQTFAGGLAMPDLDSLSKIPNRREQIKATVSELCRIHEAMYGYAWFGAHERQTSSVLDQVMRQYEELADAITGILCAESETARLVRGLLDFLTYRALRFSGGLSSKQVSEKLSSLIEPLVGTTNTRARQTRKKGKQNDYE